MNTRGKREAKTAKREQETIDAALLIVLSSSPPNHIKFQPNRLSLSLSLRMWAPPLVTDAHLLEKNGHWIPPKPHNIVFPMHW